MFRKWCKIWPRVQVMYWHCSGLQPPNHHEPTLPPSWWTVFWAVFLGELLGDSRINIKRPASSNVHPATS